MQLPQAKYQDIKHTLQSPRKSETLVYTPKSLLNIQMLLEDMEYGFIPKSTRHSILNHGGHKDQKSPIPVYIFNLSGNSEQINASKHRLR